MSDVTRILLQIDAGDPAAAEQLLPLVYDELRKLAAAKLAHEKPGQTLQATALVHEAYLRLVGNQVPGARYQEPVEADLAPGYRPLAPAFSSRGHFFASAAEAMRRILVERARRKGRLKRGGAGRRLELSDQHGADDDPSDLVLAIDESLAALAEQSAPAAQLAKLRYFAGLTLPEAAAAIEVSPRTADRLWAYAKAFLHQRLQS
jgi:DNA-directed RNA polymerase specialized sigma24 family protein